MQATARLWFRRFEPADRSVFFQLNSLPAVVQYTARPALHSEAQAAAVLRSAEFSVYDRQGLGRFAVVARQSGAVLGLVGIRPAAPEGITLASVLLGFRFLPDCWGQGIATEAGAATLRYLFDELQLPAVAATVMPANLASQRVLSKLGFVCQLMTGNDDGNLLTYYLENRLGV